MSDKIALVISIIGCVLVAGGLAWFLIRGLRLGYILDLFAPFMAFIHPKRGLWPFLIMLGGGIIALMPLLVKKIAGENVEEKPALVRDTRPITTLSLIATRPEEFEGKLKDAKNLKTLRWSNPAVTDAHLELIRGLDQLEELDLNDTKITDAGLAILATLPKLQRLGLGRTMITDEGFRKTILPIKLIDELDVTLTAVKKETVKEWTDAKLGRRVR